MKTVRQILGNRLLLVKLAMVFSWAGLAYAVQVEPPSINVSVMDAVQNQRLQDQDRHLSDIDRRLDKIIDSIDELKAKVNQFSAYVTLAAFLFGGLDVFQIVIQVKSKKLGPSS